MDKYILLSEPLMAMKKNCVRVYGREYKITVWKLIVTVLSTNVVKTAEDISPGAYHTVFFGFVVIFQ